MKLGSFTYGFHPHEVTAPPTLTQAENGNGYLSSMPDGHEFNLGPPIKATNGDLVLYTDAG